MFKQNFESIPTTVKKAMFPVALTILAGACTSTTARAQGLESVWRFYRTDTQQVIGDFKDSGNCEIYRGNHELLLSSKPCYFVQIPEGTASPEPR